MCRPKGDTIIYNHQILFDKYEVLQPLGEGSFSSVYLVQHLSLEQARAMKVYPKDHVPLSSQLMEARVLRSLSHPGIPVIFDLEEDAQNYYVIEEYIQGESLNQFLDHQSAISTEFFYMIGLQLCDIFTYLHRFTPTPILYRDLKPEHLIIRNLQLTLIDFNIAAFAASKENNLDHYGNTAFSAPENFTRSSITLSSDIYSIGKLLEYLSAYLEKAPSRNLRQILQKAVHPSPELRYETVEELAHALSSESSKKAKPMTHLEPVTIAMIGSHHGCGVTHLGISLVSVLNAHGISAVYYEKNVRNSLRNAAEFLRQLVEDKGYYHYRYFQGSPFYGPGVRISPREASVRIYDYGTAMEWEAALLADPTIISEIDHIFFVITAAPWDYIPTRKQYERLQQKGIPVTLISNFCDHRQSVCLASCLKARVYPFPADPDPFAITKKKKRLGLSLLNNF